MGLHSVLEAAEVGFGTTKLSGGAGLADTTLLAALIAAAAFTGPDYPTTVKGVDIYIASATTGAVYWENNAAATANSMPIDVGTTLRIRNSIDLLRKMHLFATGAYDIRVMLWA